MNHYYNNFPIKEEHSSAFLDIDADCTNDILITSQSNKSKKSQTFLEIWRGSLENETLKYCLTSSSVYPLDDKLGLFSLADVNRDGLIDIVFPVISDQARILIAYNMIKLNYDWTNMFCDDHRTEHLTVPQVFQELKPDLVDSDYLHTVYLLSNQATTVFYSDDYNPARIIFGDIDNDSYPDFTTVLYNKATKTQNAYIFKNSEYFKFESTSSSSSTIGKYTLFKNN